MRIFIIAVLSLTFSCKDGVKKQVFKSASSGNINNLLIVTDNQLWGGQVGDAIRSNIGDEIYGLPQIEPHFDMSQVSDDVFSDFVRKNRIVLKTIIANENTVKYYTDPYATPQKMIVVTGSSPNALIDLLKQNSDTIISTFKAVEFKERQRRINKSLYDTKSIENTLNISLKFPSAYRVAKNDHGFYWIRRDTKTGSLNLLLYSLPIRNFAANDSFSDFIISTRDSIAKQHIPGPIEGNYMQTEMAYTPFFRQATMSGVPVIETRSLWRVEGAFMSGPFVNYCFVDKPNKRLIVAEGFVYAPSEKKRDFMFELETIIRSISLK